MEPLDTLDGSPFGHKKPYLRLQKPRARNWPLDRHRTIGDENRSTPDPLPYPEAFHRQINRDRCRKTGGGGRDRTDDLKLAKLALSQLSYAPGFNGSPVQGKWWAREDLNFRPHAYQACALTN